MASVSHDQVETALKTIPVPGKGSDVLSLGLVSGLAIRDGTVNVALETSPEDAPEMEQVRHACEVAIRKIPGVLSATVVLTSERLREPVVAATPRQPESQKMGSSGVGAIIAVASGKGGVGKSTTAVNLALALCRLGKNVGILDADVFGPSVPRMMGIANAPDAAANGLLRPVENYGVKCMSMGFLVQEEEPVIWRGPMVMGALEQMLKKVEWAPLDILVVDMPPGTGDVQLTISQNTELAGAVIVSTPQDIALLDARKGLNMFRKVEVPILGMIENMSHFLCPRCGGRSDIFDTGGARRTAEKYGCEFLGEIPLDIAIRKTSDGGRPIAVSDANSPHARAYMTIAAKIAASLEKRAASESPRGPKIVIQSASG